MTPPTPPEARLPDARLPEAWLRGPLPGFDPLLMPAKIPSSRTSRRVVAIASSFVTRITSS